MTNLEDERILRIDENSTEAEKVYLRAINNVVWFCDGLSEDEIARLKYLKGGIISMLDVIARTYAVQLYGLGNTKRFNQDSIPPFRSSISELSELRGCNPKTTRKWIEVLKECGAITNIQTSQRGEVHIRLHPDIILKDQNGFAHTLA